MPKQQQKQGGHKKVYDSKMENPRFKKSKEQRGCGPLGRYHSWKLWLSDPGRFTKPTVKPKTRLW